MSDASFVIWLWGAQLSHEYDPLAILIPIKGTLDVLAGKAWIGHTGSLGGTALNFL
eukprot:CAMPEP_0197191586 /NCGR_PEP_ID=MMETSP1423-20130617/23651_1 /TAXON_ID=476441 /ORGANISM="Pseudo-nitzschia heimii, Strain UNC1101" /LENGTH=55 /DNA_ID=CAMNT_0042644269 /DNA_START=293 /DNA_END=460 /DNA_ORIENTATION=-